MLPIVVVFAAALSSLALTTMPSRPTSTDLAPSPPPPPSSSYFRVAAIWSAAGVGTCAVLEPDPRSCPSRGGGDDDGGDAKHKRKAHGPRIVFDIGATPVFDETIAAKVVCVSHGHVDHVGGIFNHARAHAVMYGGSAPTYYVPVELVPHLEAAREAMSAMDALCLDDDHGDEREGARRDKTLMKMNIVGVRAGEEIELKEIKGRDGKRLLLRTFAVSHGSHPALGYLLLTRSPPGLKPEYRGLPGKEIGALARKGVQVKEESGHVAVEAAYTGDTCKAGLLCGSAEDEEEVGDGDCVAARKARSRQSLRQALRDAPLLLCESTFLGPASDAELREMAPARGHMHILDVAEVLRGHGWGVDDHDYRDDDDDGNGSGEAQEQDQIRARRLVLFHVSARHRPAARALDLLADAVPSGLAGRTDVAATALLTDEERGARPDEGEGGRGHHRQGSCLADLVRGDGCVNIGEYVRWREEMGERVSLVSMQR